jgi:hypothetical protein
MGDAINRFAKALAAVASRRGTIAGLLAGAVMPWSAVAKNNKNDNHKKKKKKRRRRRRRRQEQEQQALLQKFAPYLGYCQQWCGYKFGFAGPAFESCVEQAKTGGGSCYSATDKGPGYFCTVTLPCATPQQCCPDFNQFDSGAPVTTGECCTGSCPQLNGTFICIN